jgi:hypothetical protein
VGISIVGYFVVGFLEGQPAKTVELATTTWIRSADGMEMTWRLGDLAID